MNKQVVITPKDIKQLKNYNPFKALKVLIEKFHISFYEARYHEQIALVFGNILLLFMIIMDFSILMHLLNVGLIIITLGTCYLTGIQYAKIGANINFWPAQVINQEIVQGEYILMTVFLVLIGIMCGIVLPIIIKSYKYSFTFYERIESAILVHIATQFKSGVDVDMDKLTNGLILDFNECLDWVLISKRLEKDPTKQNTYTIKAERIVWNDTKIIAATRKLINGKYKDGIAKLENLNKINSEIKVEN